MTSQRISFNIILITLTEEINVKTKLKKILKLSAFTLLCTSSIMAAVGDNMSAGLGVTAGTSLQEQTWMDNYSSDGSGAETEGPIAGVDFGTNFIVSDSASATSIVDFKNVYYPRIKTNVAGLAFNYKMKNAGGLGQGFYAAVDYTRYDDFNFWQAAMGHETRISGYGSNLNFYIPFGSTETYDWANGSEIVSTYGVDWTLSKKIESLDFGATISYNWHDDIKDNMTAISLGSEYTFSKNMLTTGAGYQYRDGLDSEKHGYKVYARVPLYKGIVASGMGMYGEKGLNMYKPMKRMHGGVLQAKKAECSGLESYARYGVTSCLSSNPFDAANLKGGINLNLGDKKGEVTLDSQSLHVITKNTHIDKLTMGPGSRLYITDGVTLSVGEGSSFGSNEDGSNYSVIASASEVRAKVNGVSSKAARAMSSHLRTLGAKKSSAQILERPAIVATGTSSLFLKSSTGADEVSKDHDDFSKSTLGQILHGAALVDSADDDDSGSGQGTGTITPSSGLLSGKTIGGGTTAQGETDKQISFKKVYMAGVDYHGAAVETRFNNSAFAGGHMTIMGGNASLESSVVTPASGLDSAVVAVGGPQLRVVGSVFNASEITSSEFKVFDYRGDNANATPAAAPSENAAKDKASTGLLGNHFIFSKIGGNVLGLDHLNSSTNAGNSVAMLNCTSDYTRLKLKSGSTVGSDDVFGIGNLKEGTGSQWSTAGTKSSRANYGTGRGSALMQGNQTVFASNVSDLEDHQTATHKQQGLGDDFSQPYVKGSQRLLEQDTVANQTLSTSSNGVAPLFGATSDAVPNEFPTTDNSHSTTVDLPMAVTDGARVALGADVEEERPDGSEAQISAGASQEASETTVAATRNNSVDRYQSDMPYTRAIGASQPMSDANDNIDVQDVTTGGLRKRITNSGYNTYMGKVSQLVYTGDQTTQYADSETGTYSSLKTLIGKEHSAPRTYVSTDNIINRDDDAIVDHTALLSATDNQTPIRYGSLPIQFISSTAGKPTTMSEINSFISDQHESNYGKKSGSAKDRHDEAST